MENKGRISCSAISENQVKQQTRKLITMAEKKKKVSKKEIDDMKENYQWFKRTTAFIRAGNLNQLDKFLKSGSSINKKDKHDRILLHEAATRNKRYIMLSSINRKDKHGRTLLHEAATRNKRNIVLYLLKNGANVLQTTNKGVTPLEVAFREKHMGIILILLENICSLPLHKLVHAETLTTDFTAFVIAEILKDRRASSPIAKDLDDSFPGGICPNNIRSDELSEYNYDDSADDSDDDTDEVTTENLDDLLDLDDEYKDIKSLLSTPRRFTEIFPLQVSRARELDQLLTRTEKLYNQIRDSINRLGEPCSQGSTLSLKEGSHILNCVLNILEAFELYQSPFFKRHDDPNIAILKRALKALEFDKEHSYLEAGGEFDTKGRGTRYYRLLQSKDVLEKLTFSVIVDRLIEEPTKSFIKSIYVSKIFDAVHRNDISFVSNHYCRFNNNQPPRMIDINGRAPLHVAALKNSEKMVDILLKKGANIRLATATIKSTALHIATAMGHLPVVNRLLQYDNSSAFVDAKTATKNSTALHAAANYNHLSIVKCLLANGATHCARDADGKMPADLTTNEKIADFFKLINELFTLAREGSGELAGKLKKLQKDSLLAVGNARDGKGRTLVEVAEAMGYTGVAREMKQVVGKMEKIRNRSAKKK